MRVFLSYASEQRDIAERIALGLRHDGHDVFFDRDALPAGATYDDRIRRAIARAHLFVFLASTQSLRRGAYAQTELHMAEERWTRPSGHLLPVLIDDTATETLPPSLRAVSVLQPRGDVVAEVLESVARLARDRRLARARWMAAATATLLIGAAGIWGWQQAHQRISIDTADVIAVAPTSSGSDGFRIDARLTNHDVEALTIVDIAPQTDSTDVMFSGTSTEWFNLNPDETHEVAIEVTLEGAAQQRPSRWRLCWGFVRTEDRYYELETGRGADVDMFMGRYRQETCGGWLAWNPQQVHQGPVRRD